MLQSWFWLKIGETRGFHPATRPNLTEGCFCSMIRRECSVWRRTWWDAHIRPGQVMEQILLETIVRRMEDREVTADKGRATAIIYLDLYKTFYIFPNSILFCKLERHRCEGWTVQWISNWLDVHIQRVVLKASMSRWRPEKSADPQGTLTV